MLIAAITLTGIIIPNANAVTVSAGSPLEVSVPTWNGKTVTLKPGETKQFIVETKDTCMAKLPTAQHYCTYNECWARSTSSDKNVVKVEYGHDPKDARVETVDLIGVGTGTATITFECRHDYIKGCMVTIPVKVTLPAPTKKQKKCKHSYKTTKKATCQKAGIKTCKKCKFQKEIKRTAHNYKSTTVTKIEPEGYYYIQRCNHETNGELDCEFPAMIKYYKDGGVTPDSPCKSLAELRSIMCKHGEETGHFGGYYDYEEDWGEVITEVTEERCTMCGNVKN